MKFDLPKQGVGRGIFSKLWRIFRVSWLVMKKMFTKVVRRPEIRRGSIDQPATTLVLLYLPFNKLVRLAKAMPRGHHVRGGDWHWRVVRRLAWGLTQKRGC